MDHFQVSAVTGKAAVSTHVQVFVEPTRFIPLDTYFGAEWLGRGSVCVLNFLEMPHCLLVGVRWYLIVVFHLHFSCK